ncbi:hypothetical protein BGW39_008922 [Mortierella sp. 14UC]|nr:hypothetical protein BGW39_008922 [Mortierella sp. 14UC]
MMLGVAVEKALLELKIIQMIVRTDVRVFGMIIVGKLVNRMVAEAVCGTSIYKMRGTMGAGRGGNAKSTRPNSRASGKYDIEVDGSPENGDGRAGADGHNQAIGSCDDNEAEEPLLSVLQRRRFSQRDLPTLPAPESSSISSAPMIPSHQAAPATTAAVTGSGSPITTTATATTDAGENSDVVCILTKDSCPAFSFTLGRYRASEFVILPDQHKGAFSNKTYPLPLEDSCRNVIDVLEAWRYGTSDCPPIQDLVNRFGLSWRVIEDRDRYTAFKKTVLEFRRLVLEEGIDDDAAIKGLMARQGWWGTTTTSASPPTQLVDGGDFPLEDVEVDDLDADPDYVDRSRPKSKTSDPSKELTTTSMDVSATTASTKQIFPRRQSTSTTGDIQTTASGSPVDASTPVVSKKTPSKNPRPQYKDNVVEPWGDTPLNPIFIFPTPDGIESVRDMWQAWYHGWNGTPSLFQLTKENGPTWRSSAFSKRVYDWYHCRYKVVKAIDDLVARKWVAEDAILALEKIRGKKKLSRLHLDIPCPGHMILPVRDDSEEQSHDGASSAVVISKTNNNESNSNNRLPLAFESDDSTAVASTTGSRTGSSDTITSDNSITVSSGSNNTLPTSASKSTDNVSNSSINNSKLGGSEMPSCSMAPVVGKSPKISKASLVSKPESTVDSNIALNTKDKPTTSASKNSTNPVVSTAASVNSTVNKFTPTSTAGSYTRLDPKERMTNHTVTDAINKPTACPSTSSGSSFTYIHNGSIRSLVSSRHTKENLQGTTQQGSAPTNNSGSISMIRSTSGKKALLTSKSDGGLSISSTSRNSELNISRSSSAGSVSSSNSLSVGSRNIANGNSIDDSVSRSNCSSASGVSMSRNKSAGGVNSFKDMGAGNLSRSNSMSSSVSNESVNISNTLSVGGGRIPSNLHASGFSKPYGSITGGVKMSKSKSAGGVGVIPRGTIVDAVQRPILTPTIKHNVLLILTTDNSIILISDSITTFSNNNSITNKRTFSNKSFVNKSFVNMILVNRNLTN